MKRTVKVKDGLIILDGSVIRARWFKDVLGRPLTKKQGTETWTLSDNDWGRREAKNNFNFMIERCLS